MSFFKPEDFELKNPAIAKYISCERAVKFANSKRDLALEEAKELIESTLDNLNHYFENSCCPTKDEIKPLVSWIQKYGEKN